MKLMKNHLNLHLHTFIAAIRTCGQGSSNKSKNASCCLIKNLEATSRPSPLFSKG